MDWAYIAIEFTLTQEPEHLGVRKIDFIAKCGNMVTKGNTMTLSKILEGKKTYIGIITAALGLFFAPADVVLAGEALDKILVAVGLIIAFFGRMKAKPSTKVMTGPGPRGSGGG